jgi:predicted NodU family carbamoyl transferase
MDIAASIQAVTEEVMLRLTRALAGNTNCRTFAWLAGLP